METDSCYLFIAPDSPPDNFQVFNSSSRSLRIEFDPVPPDLINGILRGYHVFYWKTREGNHTRKNFTITKEPGSNSVIHNRRRRSAVGQYHDGYPLFADIYNLEEYTNYTVQIQAITILDGVLAPPFTTLTGEDRKYGIIRDRLLLMADRVGGRGIKWVGTQNFR